MEQKNWDKRQCLSFNTSQVICLLEKSNTVWRNITEFILHTIYNVQNIIKNYSISTRKVEIILKRKENQ